MKIIELLRPLCEDDSNVQPAPTQPSAPDLVWTHPSCGWGVTDTGQVWGRHGGIGDLDTGQQITPVKWSLVPGARYLPPLDTTAAPGQVSGSPPGLAAVPPIDHHRSPILLRGGGEFRFTRQ